jgi:hypothetical protein
MPASRAAVFVILTLSIASGPVAMACAPQRHTFTSDRYIVEMDIRCFDRYLGTRLAFTDDRDPTRQICFVGDGDPGACPNRFVGAVATVTFRVKRPGGKLRGKASIREYVTVTDQSPDLPPRPPVEKTQILAEGGVITDLQAFGYDESDIAEGQRLAERERSRERLWRFCRQELYLNGGKVPFAVISWRYTLDAIDIVTVQAGGA